MQPLNKKKSILVACDCPPEEFQNLVKATIDVPGIGGYKLGMALGLRGLADATYRIRMAIKNPTCNPEVIFDYQKAGNDIPEMGVVFAREVKSAGAEHVILFPLAGPETQKKWTEACFDAGLTVSVGLAMTHPKFFVSEGGYISDEAPEIAFKLACEMGVRNFIVPGNKVHWVEKLRALLDEKIGEDKYVLRAPGFIKQGGEISECGQVAGKYWHGIIGSAIYTKGAPEKIREAATNLGAAILALP